MRNVSNVYQASTGKLVIHKNTENVLDNQNHRVWPPTFRIFSTQVHVYCV